MNERKIALAINYSTLLMKFYYAVLCAGCCARKSKGYCYLKTAQPETHKHKTNKKNIYFCQTALNYKLSSTCGVFD